VARFREQADGLLTLLQTAPLTPEQMSDDLDFQQCLAQLFTLVPYGQLILEQAQLVDTPPDVVDLVFETLVRDFSVLGVDLHGKASSTPEQQQWVLDHVRKPVVDEDRDERIYAEVRALSGAYVMPD
jgi:acyl-CoA dehydrogenase